MSKVMPGFCLAIVLGCIPAITCAQEAPKAQSAPVAQSNSAAAQPAAPTAAPAANPADVASPDAILAATYDVISGPAGQQRDWDRFRSLFYPGARLIPTDPKKDGGF